MSRISGGRAGREEDGPRKEQWEWRLEDESSEKPGTGVQKERGGQVLRPQTEGPWSALRYVCLAFPVC